MRFAEQNLPRADGHHIVVAMVGGNDISNGQPETAVAQRLHSLALALLERDGVEIVVLPTLWPRASRDFNRRAKAVSELLEARCGADPRVVIWRWDRRQPWRAPDGVHLTPNGYQRAARYLAAAIVWADNHRPAH